MTQPESFAPVGSIVAFGGPPANLPSNWMVCDGRKLSVNEFPSLWARIGGSWGGDGAPNFYLPDLRGQFLRGVDRKGDGHEGQAKQDPDRADRIAFIPPPSQGDPGNAGNNVGSFQKAATGRPLIAFVTDDPGDHEHGDPTYNGFPGQYEVAVHDRGPASYDYGPQSAPTTLAGAHTHQITAGGDAESRPVNAYVYYIIRAE